MDTRRIVCAVAALATVFSSLPLQAANRLNVPVPGLVVTGSPETPSNPDTPTTSPAQATLSAVNFGSVTVGQTASRVATLSNTGGSTLSVSTKTVTGSGFSLVSSTCGSSLPAGGSCSLTVRFAPTAQGAASGAMAVDSSAGTATAALTGTGVSGSTPPDTSPAQATLTGVSFGSVTVGQTSTQAATLTNTGGSALGISAKTATGAGFTLVSSDCGTSLAAGSSCSLNVRFAPTTEGAATGVLSLTTSVGTTTATLAGTGVSTTPSPQAVLSSVSFGSYGIGASPTASATLSNPGTASLSLQTPDANSVAGQAFNFVGTTCTDSLPAGASCQIQVRFEPQAAGNYSGSVAVSTELGTRTAALSATATSGPNPAYTLSIDRLNFPIDFGMQRRGTTSAVQQVTVRNMGTVDQQLEGVSIVSGSAHYAQSNSCGGTLAPNATCSINVTFTPAAYGSLTGVLSIYNAESGTYSINLFGEGTDALPTLAQSQYGPLAAYTATSLTVTGTNLDAVQSAKLGTTPLTIVSRSATSLGLSIPATFAGGLGMSLSLTNSTGQSATAAVYTYWPDLQQVGSMSPTTVRAGTASTLTATVRNVYEVTSASIPGRALSATLGSNDVVSIGVSTLVAAGSYPVSLTAVGDRTITVGTLTVKPALTLTSMSAPAKLLTGQTQSVTLQGTGLSATDTVTVTANGSNATVSNVTSTANTNLTFNVAFPSTTGTVVFTVTGQDGATTTFQSSIGTIDTMVSNGARMWENGSVAANCNAYRTPASSYVAQTSSGLYWVNGTGANVALYCDMVNNGGGWTLVARGLGGSPAGWGTTGSLNAGQGSASNANSGSTWKLSDAEINALRGSSGIYRLVSDGKNNYTRFAGAHTYGHTTSRTSGGNVASSTWGNAALNSGYLAALTSQISGGAYKGITDDAGSYHSYFTTNTNNNRWMQGSGPSGTSTTFCQGDVANCNMTMWVR